MAEMRPSYDSKRTDLRDKIPLASPLSMYVEPTRMCNLKCFYCMHATRGAADGELAKTGFKIAHMPPELWSKILPEIMAFEEQPRRICFSGLGEPLMNPKLPDMIRSLRKEGFTRRIDIITNGILLEPAMADELVDAGVSRIQISVQALTAGKYKDNAGREIDVEQYISNIRYLYNNKKDAVIFIKIIDANLDSEAEKQQFMDTYGGICDNIFIEHLVIMQHQMGDHGGAVDTLRNLNNEPFVLRDCCGIMYYFLQVNSDGDTYPCSTPGLPTDFSMGNACGSTLQQIWNGAKRNQMLRQNLISGYRTFEPCRECSSVNCITDPAENLDDCREELLVKLPRR